MWSLLVVSFLSLNTQRPNHDVVASLFRNPKQSEEAKQERKDWLQQRLGMDEKETETLTQKPKNFRLLALRSDENVGPTLDWLEDRFELDQASLKKLVTRFPTVLGLQASTLDSKVEFLKEKLDLSDKQVAKAVISSPNLLGLSVDNMSQKLNWLEDRLDFNTTKSLQKAVRQAPMILGLTIDNLETKLQWFEERLSMTPSRLVTTMRGQPILLTKGVDNLETKVSWLQERLVISNDQLCNLFDTSAASNLFSIGTETLELRLSWLQSCFGLDDEGLRSLVCQKPTILKLRLENIKPKMEFFANVLGEDDAIRAVAANPVLLTCSLEGRIKPRYAEATKLGMVMDKPLLILLVKYTNEKWGKKVEKYKLKKLANQLW